MSSSDSWFGGELQRLTHILDHANDAYFLVDYSTQLFIYVNHTACHRLGYSPDEFLRMSVPDINPAMTREMMTALLGRLKHERIPPYEAMHRRKDGSLLPVEMSATVIVVEGREMVLAAARDITERKRTEAALAEENRINDILNRVGTLVAAELDRDRAAQIVTDAATELTTAQFGAFFYNVVSTSGESYQLYTLSGVPREAFSRFPMPRNTPIFGPTFTGAKVVRLDDVTKDPRYGQVAPHYGMPAGHLPVRSYLAVPVAGRAGVIGGLFFGHASAGVFTERHERLAVGLASWAAIASENARLYAQVKDALDEARRANLLKDEFLAVLSHELRTPLNAILGWTHLLGSSEPDRSMLSKGLETIGRNAHLQLQLIEDLLDVSAALTGNLRLQLLPVNVANVTQAAIAAVHPSAQAKHLTVTDHVDAPHARVFGDSRRLQQIIWNLLTNAIKFTPEGGRISVTVTTRDADVLIRVQDTGEGIAPGFLPRVFDRFRQGDASATRRHGGLGLGLALVQSFAQAHGGRVEAHSDGKGHGATFTVCLPLHATADAHADPTDPGAHDELRSMDGVQILVVDDDGDSREVMMSMLQRAGAAVRTVASAQAALDVLLTWRPRIILSDLAMPEIDGIAFLRLLRARPTEHGGDIPVIGVTAYVGLERRDEARVAGFERLLIKPVRAETLIQAIAETIASAESLS